MDAITVRFVHEKDTSGAVRYQEVNDKGEVVKQQDGAAVGQFYLRKSALKGSAPKKLVLTIKEE